MTALVESNITTHTLTFITAFCYWHTHLSSCKLYNIITLKYSGSLLTLRVNMRWHDPLEMNPSPPCLTINNMQIVVKIKLKLIMIIYVQITELSTPPGIMCFADMSTNTN